MSLGGAMSRGAALVTFMLVTGSMSVAPAAFTASNGLNAYSVTTSPDVAPPTISRAVVAKTSGAAAGTIRQGGHYYVYAEVTDASGVQSVAAETSIVDTGATAAAMTTAGGPWTVDALSYNHRSALLTATSWTTAGASYAYDIGAIDTFANGGIQSYSVPRSPADRSRRLAVNDHTSS